MIGQLTLMKGSTSAAGDKQRRRRPGEQTHGVRQEENLRLLLGHNTSKHVGNARSAGTAASEGSVVILLQIPGSPTAIVFRLRWAHASPFCPSGPGPVQSHELHRALPSICNACHPKKGSVTGAFLFLFCRSHFLIQTFQ